MAQQQQKDPVWTPQKAQEAQLNQLFIRISDKPGAGNTSSIGGATTVWQKNPDFIYIPGLWVAGKRNVVADQLLKLGMGEADLQGHLQNAITLQNSKVPQAQGGKQELYEQLVADRREYTKAQPTKPKPVPSVTLGMLADTLATLAEAKRNKNLKDMYVERAGSPKKPRTGTSTKSFRERLDNLKANSVLDVSSLEVKPDGTTKGARSKPAPGPSGRSQLVGVEGLPVMVNYKNAKAAELYRTALSLLQGSPLLERLGGANNVMAQFNRNLAARFEGKNTRAPTTGAGNVAFPAPTNAGVLGAGSPLATRRASPLQTQFPQPQRSPTRGSPTRMGVPLTRGSPTRMGVPLTRGSPTRMGLPTQGMPLNTQMGFPTAGGNVPTLQPLTRLPGVGSPTGQ